MQSWCPLQDISPFVTSWWVELPCRGCDTWLYYHPHWSGVSVLTCWMLVCNSGDKREVAVRNIHYPKIHNWVQNIVKLSKLLWNHKCAKYAFKIISWQFDSHPIETHIMVYNLSNAHLVHRLVIKTLTISHQYHVWWHCLVLSSSFFFCATIRKSVWLGSPNLM